MKSVRLPEYSDRQNRALPRIIEIISADEIRSEARYKTRRQHDRRRFQGPVHVCQPTAEIPAPSPTHPSALTAWAYNLSTAGIGFVAPQLLAEAPLSIGLKLGDGSLRWMPGRIVRARQIPQEEFYDYGVVFEQAKENQPAKSEAAQQLV